MSSIHHKQYSVRESVNMSVRTRVRDSVTQVTYPLSNSVVLVNFIVMAFMKLNVVPVHVPEHIAVERSKWGEEPRCTQHRWFIPIIHMQTNKQLEQTR